MAIHLKPETEALIMDDVERGPYKDVSDFVEHAVAMLHAQEQWLSENRLEISTKIEAGFESAQRGELVDGDKVREHMAEHKRAWLEQQRNRS